MATKKAHKRKKRKGLKGTSLITTDQAKRAASNTASYAKDNTQTLLILAALAVGGYFVYKAIKGIGSTADAIGDVFNGDAPGSGGGTVTPGNTNVPSGATISPNQAQSIAAGLFEAMNGYGTDEEKIFSLLRGKNKVDFALISQAFGEPRLGAWPGNPRNLSYWLNSELSTSEINQLKAIMQGVF